MTATTTPAATQRANAITAIATAIDALTPGAGITALDTGHDRIDVAVHPAHPFGVTDAAHLLERHCSTCDGSRAKSDLVVRGVCTRFGVAVWVTVNVAA